MRDPEMSGLKLWDGGDVIKVKASKKEEKDINWKEEIRVDELEGLMGADSQGEHRDDGVHVQNTKSLFSQAYSL